jgi:endonuclease YncB( thermonuclease family)
MRAGSKKSDSMAVVVLHVLLASTGLCRSSGRLPSEGQAYGQKAKQAASELVFGKEVTFQTHSLDKYGGTLADVLLPDGTHVNHVLLKDGWC